MEEEVKYRLDIMGEVQAKKDRFDALTDEQLLERGREELQRQLQRLKQGLNWRLL